MKKKKALFVCQNILEFKDKILPCFMLIANKQYDIHIACNEEIDIAFASSIHLINGTEVTNIFKNRDNINTLIDLIKKERYDVIHTLDNVSSYIVNIALNRINNEYIEFFAHVENLKKNLNKLISTLKHADIVIVNNEEDYKFIVDKKYNSNVNLIYDLAIDFRKYNNLDVQKNREILREKFNLDKEKKYVLAIMEDLDYNYLSDIIKEISMQNSKICFLIKGLDEKYISILEKNKCLENIKVVEDAKWLEMLTCADSVMFSNILSYDINLLVYSLMLGIPIVAPQNCSARYYIEDSKNGFLYHSKDVQQAVLAIGKSVNIPKIRLDELPKLNYNYISKFDQEKYAYNMSDMYDKVKEDTYKDVYIIEDLKKREDTEKLMADIKNSKSTSPLIITIGKSINDDKLMKCGAQIITFNIKTFNEKFKFRKFIIKTFEFGKYGTFSVYGNMNKILKKNRILIYEKNVICRYEKI